jgi:hypothetical protein
MCHVSDPCASSPWPLDQTVIRLMVEMGWSCTSLHASMHWGRGARGGQLGAFICSLHRLPLVLVVDCMRATGAQLHAARLHGCGYCSPAGVDYILCEIDIFLLWVLNIANDMSISIISTRSSQWSTPNIYLSLLCNSKNLNFFSSRFSPNYIYVLLNIFWCTFPHILQKKSIELKLMELVR